MVSVHACVRACVRSCAILYTNTQTNSKMDTLCKQEIIYSQHYACNVQTNAVLIGTE